MARRCESAGAAGSTVAPAGGIAGGRCKAGSERDELDVAARAAGAREKIANHVAKGAQGGHEGELDGDASGRGQRR